MRGISGAHKPGAATQSFIPGLRFVGPRYCRWVLVPALFASSVKVGARTMVTTNAITTAIGTGLGLVVLALAGYWDFYRRLRMGKLPQDASIKPVEDKPTAMDDLQPPIRNFAVTVTHVPGLARVLWRHGLATS